ncbi:MAG: tRNA preQ1(34) S-adenosylmethionine ribosyltransferase-isomerase QueA [Flavobacteriales bacterium TMED191]|nr:MAG: tRNA preQ1(34) S-adenosylmethionine ribosyltransferase-isomerase QueA [Flavobacteriales bacterium TMED191]|tara:strand:+ start:2895 stop:3953 length:1059 start_codon:yes stop_codon:yes gene_type:complete
MIKLKLSHFDFKLPPELLAIDPLINRDESRMMVIHRDSGKIEHRKFTDILDYFNEDDVMVLNNTKVIPARLYGNKEKTGAKIEVFLMRELNKESRLWDVLVDPARKIRIGNKLYFGENDELIAEVIDNTTSRGRTLRFLHDAPYSEFKSTIERLGQTPLPKYINREPTKHDEEMYQTVYAQHKGAVAAPTAGLHFSKIILKKLEILGVHLPEITLHIGLGTFRPVEVEDLSKHKMDSEEVFINSNVADVINNGIKNRRRICAIGTTSIRAMETPVSSYQTLKPFEGWTNKFIFPPYNFQIANSLLTNFHDPKSTVLMLVSAFAGHDLIMRAYKEAVKEKYKFLSYGDCMLII